MLQERVAKALGKTVETTDSGEMKAMCDLWIKVYSETDTFLLYMVKRDEDRKRTCAQFTTAKGVVLTEWVDYPEDSGPLPFASLDAEQLSDLYVEIGKRLTENNIRTKIDSVRDGEVNAMRGEIGFLRGLVEKMAAPCIQEGKKS